MNRTRTRIRRILICAAAVLLVAGLGIVAMEGWRQRELLQIAHRTGGEIGWTPRLDNCPARVRSLEPFPFVHTPRQIILSKSTSPNDVRRFFDILADSPRLCSRIEGLYLWDSSTTTADLQRLPELPSLTTLELDGTHVDDGCTGVLSRFPTLQLLSFRETGIADDALAAMPLLPQLRCIDLSGTQVTDKCLRSLPGLPSLQRVDVRQTPAVMSKWPGGEDPYAPVELPWLEAKVRDVLTETPRFVVGRRKGNIRLRMFRAGGDPKWEAVIIRGISESQPAP